MSVWVLVMLLWNGKLNVDTPILVSVNKFRNEKACKKEIIRYPRIPYTAFCLEVKQRGKI